MPHLFEPLTLRGVTLPNRIGVSPMCQYSALDGYPDDWHLVHLGSRAVGGAGLVVTEASAVTADGRITGGDLGLWEHGQIEAHARITRFVRDQGSVAGIQLAHAGRKSGRLPPWEERLHAGTPAERMPEIGGWLPRGPSALAFDERSLVPHELSVADIAAITDAFVAATRRALDAGYELVELHGAHGYLMHSFLSPLSNRRTDSYGGALANRCRFVVETARAVRAVWPERLPLLVRISHTDWVEGGWGTAESVELARWLKDEGVDMMDVSSGGSSPAAKIPTGPGYQVPGAEAVRREAGLPTAAVGMITEPRQADAIVREGRADLVLLARELLREPYWPLRAAIELGHAPATRLPVQYERAHGRTPGFKVDLGSAPRVATA